MLRQKISIQKKCNNRKNKNSEKKLPKNLISFKTAMII